MDVFSIAGFALVAAILAMTVKQYRPELAIQISIAAGVILMLIAIGHLTGIINDIRMMIEVYGLSGDLTGVIIRVVGIAYIAQLAAHMCKDMGESALAMKVELCGRLLILSVAMPHMLRLTETLVGLINEAL